VVGLHRVAVEFVRSMSRRWSMSRRRTMFELGRSCEITGLEHVASHHRHKGKGHWEGRGRVRHPRREEHNPRVVFVASGVVEGEGKGEGHPRREEHDNTTLGSCSSCLGW